MWTERKPARGSHVPAFPPINSQTSLLQSSSRRSHQHRYPKSPPHACDSTPRTSSAVFKDGENLQCQYSLSQLTRRDEGITCSPSLFMQLEDRVAMLEQASRTHQEELVHVQAVVRGRQGSMLEDMRQLRSSMDVQGATVEVDLSSLREQLKRLGEEQGATRDGLARVLAATERLDNTNLQLREHTDSKVSELEAGLTEVRRLLTHLESEWKRQEIWLKESFSQLQDQQLWLSHQIADSLQNIAMEMEGREKRAAADHAQLVTRVSSALKESKRECQEEGERVRESLGAQISDFDKALNDECDARSNLRAELSSKIVAMWEETAEKVDKDISQLRASVEQKHQSMERAQSTMRDSLTLLEREGRVAREDLSTVLNAEITTRQEEVLRLQSQCARLQEVCRGSVAGLREALISLEERMEAGRKEVHSLEQRLVSEWQDMGRRILADVTARLSALHQHIIPRSSSPSAERDTQTVRDAQTEREKDLETREAAARLRQQELEHHEHWQRVVREEVESLHNRMQQNSNQLYLLTTALQELQLKLVGQIQQETNERFHAILDLRNEIAVIQAQMPVLFESTHTPLHPPPTGHTPRQTNQPPVTHVQELPHPRGPKFARFVASNHLPQLQQRMTTGTDHEYSSMLGQTTHGTTKTPNYFELPRTGAVSIEEEGVHESYVCEGSPDLDDTESEESEESVEVYQEPRLAVHRPRRRDLLETSPEPHSLHSSISESYLKRGKMPLSRVRAEQRYRIQNAERFHRHFPINRHIEGADRETQGTFTSAAPTPDSQQRVLLRPRHPKEEEADGGEQEEEADGGEQEEEADGGEQEEEADGGEQEEEADGGEQEEEAEGGEQEEEADGGEQEEEEQSVFQRATSQTQSVQDSDGNAHDNIETASAAGEISALTKGHQVTLDRPPSHGLDTRGPEGERQSGDSVVEDIGYSVQGRTPSFSSQLDAEQPYGGAGPGDSERASSSEGDLQQTGESDVAAK